MNMQEEVEYEVNIYYGGRGLLDDPYIICVEQNGRSIAGTSRDSGTH